MKDTRITLYAYRLLLGCLLVVWGCGEDRAPEPSGMEASSMTAVVNGADWASSNGNFKLGARTVTGGASAFVSAGDTLTLIGVQVQGADTTAIQLQVKMTAEKVGVYKIRSGTSGEARAYYFKGLSAGARRATMENYGGGITNGNLRISEYDKANYRVSGDFAFSMAASGQTTYTVVAGKIQNVGF